MRLEDITDLIAAYIEDNESVKLITSTDNEQEQSAIQVDATSAMISERTGDFITLNITCELSKRSRVETCVIGGLFVLLSSIDDKNEDETPKINVLGKSERLNLYGNGMIRQSISFNYYAVTEWDRVIEQLKEIEWSVTNG
jgi:hypothetical protein